MKMMQRRDAFQSVLLFVITTLLATSAGPIGTSGLVLAQAPGYPAPATVRQSLARLLERPKVAVGGHMHSATVVGKTVVEQRSFVSEPGKNVPALIVRGIVAPNVRQPAVIVLHGTGGTKEQMRDWLDGFASRGYVALAIDARYHGEWIPGGARGSQEYNNAAIAAWRSDSAATREYPFWYDSAWDVVRAVDYLVSRADVDPARIGVLGVSMGGIQAYFAAAIDTRIAAIVPIIATQSMRWSLENNQWQGRARTIDAAHKAAAACGSWRHGLCSS